MRLIKWRSVKWSSAIWSSAIWSPVKSRWFLYLEPQRPWSL